MVGDKRVAASDNTTRRRKAVQVCILLGISACQVVIVRKLSVLWAHPKAH